MQAIIHLPNKARSLIKPSLTHGTFKEKTIDSVKRYLISAYAKYKLFSVDPQFDEKGFLKDAKRAYNLFLDSLVSNDMQSLKKVTTSGLFRSMTNRGKLLKDVRNEVISGDMNAKLFGYAFAKIDIGTSVVNHFQIAVIFGGKKEKFETVLFEKGYMDSYWKIAGNL